MSAANCHQYCMLRFSPLYCSTGSLPIKAGTSFSAICFDAVDGKIRILLSHALRQGWVFGTTIEDVLHNTATRHEGMPRSHFGLYKSLEGPLATLFS